MPRQRNRGESALSVRNGVEGGGLKKKVKSGGQEGRSMASEKTARRDNTKRSCTAMVGYMQTSSSSTMSTDVEDVCGE